MKTTGALLLLVGATAVALPPEWLHNPRERTASGVRAWERGDHAAAARAFDQALELDRTLEFDPARERGGEDAQRAFNAGTGHLGAGAPGAAMPLLERAAAAEGALRPDALYNLGNARLAANDTAGAIAAYESSLRLAPEHAAAKHNLELALRKQQEQQEQQEPDEGPGGGGEGEPQSGEEGQQDPQRGEQPPQPQPGGEQQSPGQPGGADPRQPPSAGGEQRPGERSSRLPQFDPQEDMSADQAAALLEAVENLEREQRRAQAEEQRRQRGRDAVEKDW